MKNTFGNLLQITLFGESHGAAIGCVIDGLPVNKKTNGKTQSKRSYFHSTS